MGLTKSHGLGPVDSNSKVTESSTDTKFYNHEWYRKVKENTGMAGKIESVYFNHSSET